MADSSGDWCFGEYGDQWTGWLAWWVWPVSFKPDLAPKASPRLASGQTTGSQPQVLSLYVLLLVASSQYEQAKPTSSRSAAVAFPVHDCTAPSKPSDKYCHCAPPNK